VSNAGTAAVGAAAGRPSALRLPAGARKITARLYRIALVRWADVPRAAVKHLGEGSARGLDARLHFNGDLDRVTLLRGKRGHWRLAFKVELLRAAGVDAGDTVTFALTPDTASREPELPDEMRREFQARPELARRWAAHSVAPRRQVVRYIEQAKSPEARARRCWIFLERLAETGSLRQKPD
jgi:hypothetical protein